MNVNRRQFVGMVGAGAAVVAAGTQRARAIDSSEVLRVGLIGCGGRGRGAASQALAADPMVKLTALGDAFPLPLENTLKNLRAKESLRAKIEVPEERRFVGFDAYEQVLRSGVDVVLLATPPHFRPLHLKAAIEAGKHVFAEKPVAVDAPGIHSVLATCREAKAKGLSVVSGLCLRYNYGFRETVQRIHDGAIGDVRTLQANDFRGPIWVKPRQPGWSDMEWQMRNWYYFTWLSGDFNVEQHVHYLDVCSWVMNGEYPVRAVGMGGRQVRTGEEYGNIFDHHSVIYEYANGARLYSNCRQQAGCHNDMACRVTGTRGDAELTGKVLRLTSPEPWRYRGPKNNHYQTEHDELFAAIRKGEPIYNGEYMAKSTLLAIMGRMATYTGKEITWEMALNSKENLTPARYAWGDLETPEVARPGVTPYL